MEEELKEAQRLRDVAQTRPIRVSDVQTEDLQMNTGARMSLVIRAACGGEEDVSRIDPRHLNAAAVVADGVNWRARLVNSKAALSTADWYGVHLARLPSNYKQFHEKMAVIKDTMSAWLERGERTEEQTTRMLEKLGLKVFENDLRAAQERAICERITALLHARSAIDAAYHRLHMRLHRLRQAAAPPPPTKTKAGGKRTRAPADDEDGMDEDEDEDDEDDEPIVRNGPVARAVGRALRAVGQAVGGESSDDESDASDDEPPLPPLLPPSGVPYALGDRFPKPVDPSTLEHVSRDFSAARGVTACCAVCEQHCSAKTSHVVPLATAALGVLKPVEDADLPLGLVQYYSVPGAPAGSMLSPFGVVDADGKRVAVADMAIGSDECAYFVRVCAENCYQPLLGSGKPKVPSVAIANGFWVGPALSTSLTPSEQRALALLNPNGIIRQARGARGGGALSVQSRIGFYTMRPLPQSASSCFPARSLEDEKSAETVIVVFAGNATDGDWIKRNLREHVIRVDPLMDAFKELQDKQHPAYVGLRADDDRVAVLCAAERAGDPACKVVMVNEDDLSDEVKQRMAAEGAQLQERESDAPIVTNLALPVAALAGETAESRMRADLEKGANIVDGDRVEMHNGSFYTDNDWLVRAYPTLFAHGRGDPLAEQKRHRRVNLDVRVAALMNHFSDRFARHPGLLFALFDYVRLQHSFRRTHIGIAAVRFDDADLKLDAADLAGALSRKQERQNRRMLGGDGGGDGDGPLSGDDDDHGSGGGDDDDADAAADADAQQRARAADKLVSAMAIGSDQEPWSAGVRASMRNVMTSAVETFGEPTLFVTVNPNDVYDAARMFESARIDGNLPPDLQFDPTNNASIRAWAEQNKASLYVDANRDTPASVRAVVGAFERWLKHVLLGGALGLVRHYIFSVECQCRGSLHFHGLVWLRGAPRSYIDLAAYVKSGQRYTTASQTAPPPPPPPPPAALADGDDGSDDDSSESQLATQVIQAASAEANQARLAAELVAFHQSIIDANFDPPPPTSDAALATLERLDGVAIKSQFLDLDAADWALSAEDRQHRLDAMTRALAECCQAHPPNHGAVCIKGARHGVTCRFGFPLQERAAPTHLGVGPCTDDAPCDGIAAVDDRVELHVQRRESARWTNPTNPALLRLLRTNSDVKLLLAQSSASCTFYVTKYISKSNAVEFLVALGPALEKALPRVAERAADATGKEQAKRIANGVAYWLGNVDQSSEVSAPAALLYMLALGGVVLRGITPAGMTGECVTSVRYASLPILQAINFLRNGALHAAVQQVRDGDHGSGAVRSLRLSGALFDYINRSPALDGVCLQRFVSEFEVVAKKAAKTPHWRLRPPHPRHKTHVICQRRESVLAVSRGLSYLPAPNAPSTEAREWRCAILVARFLPFRTPLDWSAPADCSGDDAAADDEDDEEGVAADGVVAGGGARRVDKNGTAETFAKCFERRRGELTPESLELINSVDRFSDARRNARSDARKKAAEAADRDQGSGAATTAAPAHRERGGVVVETDWITAARALGHDGAADSDDDEADDANDTLWAQRMQSATDGDDDGAAAVADAAALRWTTTTAPASVKRKVNDIRQAQNRAADASTSTARRAPPTSLAGAAGDASLLAAIAATMNAGADVVPPIVEREPRNERAGAAGPIFDGAAGATLRATVNAVADEFGLTAEQTVSFTIAVVPPLEQIVWLERKQHALDHRLDVRLPPFPLPVSHMLLGEGGSGKSRVIKAIVALFARLGRPDAVRTCAFMALAARSVGGTTIHSLFCVNLQSEPVAKDEVLLDRLAHVRLFIADEVSAISGTLLAAMMTQLRRVSTLQSTTRGSLLHGVPTEALAHGFASLMVAGDFSQLQPPRVPTDKLVCALPSSSSAALAQAQQCVRDMLVVILEQQFRARDDPDWAALLRRLRNRVATDADAITLMRRATLVAGQADDVIKRMVGEFLDQPAGPHGACIVTMENRTRALCNTIANAHWCAQNRDALIYVFFASDSYSIAHGAARDEARGAGAGAVGDDDDVDDNDDNDELAADGNYIADNAVSPELANVLHETLLHEPCSLTGDVPSLLQLAPGMPVTFTRNAGVSSRAIALATVRNQCGTIVAVVPDESRLLRTRGRRRYYSGPPTAVIVRVDGSEINVDGLPAGCVVVVPCRVSFDFDCSKRLSAKVRKSLKQRGVSADGRVAVSRFGLQLEVSRALTDYKVQGQTKSAVLFVHLGKLPRPLYTVCSRVGSLDGISFVLDTPLTADVLNGFSGTSRTAVDNERRRARVINAFVVHAQLNSAATLLRFGVEPRQLPAVVASVEPQQAPPPPPPPLAHKSPRVPRAAASAARALVQQQTSTPVKRAVAPSSVTPLRELPTSAAKQRRVLDTLFLANWHYNSCATDQFLPLLVVAQSALADAAVFAARLTDEALTARVQSVLPAELYVDAAVARLARTLASSAPDPLNLTDGPWFRVREALHAIVSEGSRDRAAVGDDAMVRLVLALGVCRSLLSAPETATTQAATVFIDSVHSWPPAQLRQVIKDGCEETHYQTIVFNVFNSLATASQTGNPTIHANATAFDPPTLVVRNDGLRYRLMAVTYCGGWHFVSEVVVSGAQAQALGVRAGVWHADLKLHKGCMVRTQTNSFELLAAFRQGVPVLVPQVLVYERV